MSESATLGRAVGERVNRSMGQRYHRIDNIRFILIFLVVFAHLIEPMRNADTVGAVYTVIYVFHMPAFVFLTGYFARFSWRRIGVLALEYAVFQIIYLLVDWALAGSVGAPEIQFLVPDWIMWYLLATFVLMLLVPAFKTSNRARMAVTLGVSIAIAIAAGFFDDIGYFLSVSRILVFAPFFIAGYYVRRLAQPDPADSNVQAWKPPRKAMAVVGAVGAAATIATVLLVDIPPASLYNSLSYALTETGPLMRLGMMALAGCWICLLFAVVPNKNVCAITYAGSHTMPIYLLHGLVVRVLRSMQLLGGVSEACLIAVAIVIAAVLVFAFGNKACDKIVRFDLK